MSTRTARNASAFSLVEVTLALGVAGFCLVAIFGLLPVALSSNQAAIQQTVADSILTAVVSDLRATARSTPVGSATNSGQYSISIPDTGSSATQTLYFISEQQLATSPASASYRMTVTFLAAPIGGGAKSASMLNVKVSWPAAVNPATGTPFGVVQAFTALDRN